MTMVTRLVSNIIGQHIKALCICRTVFSCKE